jgi:ABC-type uncharacterized transport system permease subunit
MNAAVFLTEPARYEDLAVQHLRTLLFWIREARILAMTNFPYSYCQACFALNNTPGIALNHALLGLVSGNFAPLLDPRLIHDLTVVYMASQQALIRLF